VEVIEKELVNKIAMEGGIYPREYLMQTLLAKEMNYATACYHLLLKREQYIAKHQHLIIP